MSSRMISGPSETPPQFYTDAAQWAEVTALQYMTRGQGAEQPEVFYVADIDDTLIDSNLRWYEDYVSIAHQKGIESQQVVGPDTFKRVSPRICFIELGFTHEDYDAYKTERIHNVDFHQNMPALGSVCVALEDFRQSGYLPGAYLSTRPAVLGEVTKQNLHALDFAPAPLLVRSAAYDYSNTILFKTHALTELRNRFDNLFLDTLPITYIDDYKGVIEGIQSLGRPGLNAVLFEGDQTWTKLAAHNP